MRTACSVLAAILVFAQPQPAPGYQTYGVRAASGVVALKWKTLPVRYFVTNRGAGSITATQLQQAVGRAFSSWQQVATSSASADFAGFTAADPFDDDGMITLGFMNRPDLERVLGATNFLVDDVTGEIVESDIFFNGSFPWSVSSSGESGRYDLESIALHEIGHLFGLGHSALGETELRTGGGRRVIAAESVMFPIAFSAGSIAERAPRADDVAGLSVLYPDAGFEKATGTVQGHVTQEGRGVFGAHVVAFNPATGTMVGGFTVDQTGWFAIGGLEPGLHVLRIEPVDDADLDSFFDEPQEVELNFPVTYHERYVAVPRGGATEMVEIEVARLAGVSTPPAIVTVRDPTTIEFGPSADHDARLADGRAMVERYVIEIYPRGGSEAVLVSSLGKPAPGQGGVVALNLSSAVAGWPPKTGTYDARVSAWGPTGVGRSEASNPFSIGTIIDLRPSVPRVPGVGEAGSAISTASVGGRTGGGRTRSWLVAVRRAATSAFGWTVGGPAGGQARLFQSQMPPAASQPAGQGKPPGGQSAKPQVRPAPRPNRLPGRVGSFDLAAGYLWSAGSSIGSREATMTSNPGGASPLVYFSTSGTIDASGALDLRLGYRLTRRLGVEAAAAWSRPSVGLRVTGDYEGAPSIDVAGERLDQFLFGGGLVYRPFAGRAKPVQPVAKPPATAPAKAPAREPASPQAGTAKAPAKPPAGPPTKPAAASAGMPGALPAAPPRTSVFLSVGGGYLRHLHESRTLVETGAYWQAGAGVDYLVRRAPLMGTSGVSLRLNAGFGGVSGGTSFNGRSRAFASAGASLVLHF